MKPQEIKELRTSKKLTQQQLAELLGFNKSAVSSWESGDRNPSGPALKILHQLRDGELVVTELSELELKLLDENVKAGKFNDREDYLTKSLKHLLVHGAFLEIQPIPMRPALGLVAEDDQPYHDKETKDSYPNESNNVTDPHLDSLNETNENGGESNTQFRA